MMDTFLGIDIGTSGVRAALFDMEGNQLGLSHKEYPMICTEPGMAELNPETVFSTLLEVVKSCRDKIDKNGVDSLKAIGFSTQLSSLIALDTNGNCLTNLFTWADTRAVHHADKIKAEHDYISMYKNTGCRVQHPMYPISKILWLRDVNPAIVEQTYKFVTIKSYILFKLTGQYVIDYTDASATGCFNIHNFEWDPYILNQVLCIDEAKLCKTVPCTFLLDGIKAVYAEKMNISVTTPLIIGSGDGMCANAGCGVLDDTAMSSTIGTSGALRISVNTPLIDPEQRTWCYCFTKDMWVAGGAINNGGIVLKWLREDYRKQYEYECEINGLNEIYELFDKYAAEINPGSDGLLFLPFLTGERSPNWNANAKGTIYGLQLIHGKKHFIRAAMEGVMFRMFSVFETIAAQNNHVKQIKANGGYVNSDIWLQIQADIFNREIAVAGIGEAAAFGAAYLAMAGIGTIKDLKQLLPKMQPSKVITPISKNNAVYVEAYAAFKELYRKIYV